MSQSWEGAPRSGEEEENPGEKPLIALAPWAGLLEEGPAPATANPAFQCLDEVLAAGKISGTRVAELKASFTLLLNTLKSSQESEIQLLQKAKRFGAELQGQRRELEQAERFLEGPDTEVSRMRQQLLKIHNDLWEAEERENQLQFQLECLQEEKNALQMEYETQPKPVEQEKKVNALTDSCEELKKEIAQRRLETKSLKEDVEARWKQVQREQRELDDKKEMIEINEAELAQLLSVPGQLGKAIEKVTRRKTDVEKKKVALEEQLSEIAVLLKTTETRSRAVEEERREVARELEGRRAHLEASEREHRLLLKEQDMVKEKEAIIMGQRGMLDINIAHVALEKKNLHEDLGRKLRDKDRQLRTLKKLELQLKLAEDLLTQAQFQFGKTKTQKDAIPKDDGTLLQRKKLENEVIRLKKNLLQQQSLAEVEAQTAERWLEVEQKLIEESHRRREELHHLNCLTQIKADEREQKSRELVRAEQRYNRIKQELRGKTLVIQEHKKQNQEVQSRLSVFAKLYNLLKGERNKCVNLITMASQRAAEMKEKFKILENEVDILRTTAILKEKQLQKSRLKHLHGHAVRDSLRNDISKVAWLLHEMRDKREEQKLNLGKLAHTINLHEQELLQLRKSHDGAVRCRNERGVQLLEREEELCVFYEKVNVQEGLIQNGNAGLQAAEEEIHFLKMLASEENRQIEILRKTLPCMRSLEAESATLQIQLLLPGVCRSKEKFDTSAGLRLYRENVSVEYASPDGTLSECNDRILVLKKAVEDPRLENRARELEGKDPSPVELLKKIERLEVRLAKQEEQLMEKDLVYEQVTRLSQRILPKVENGQQDTLELAKKVNELQSRVKDTTKKMMAVVSELSMRQASAMALQQEIRDKELFLDSCHRRLEQGLAPSQDMEQEWQRTLRDERRRQEDLQEKARLMEAEERNQLPSGVYTTAEARPNAYIPQGDDLPLPRPYGALAPFKPSEPGSNMRHVRKPEVKPIEI